MKTGSGFRWLEVFGTVWVLVLEWIVGVNKLMIPQVCSIPIQFSYFNEKLSMLSVGERKIIPLVEPWLKSTPVDFDRSKLIEDPIE